MTAASKASTIGAPSYAVCVNGDLTFTGTETLVATADIHYGDFAGAGADAGVYIQRDLVVNGGTLEGKVIGLDSKKESYGIYAAGSITVNSGTLEGGSGTVDATNDPNVITGTSEGVSADKVTVTGGTLTGIGNKAKAAQALSYGLYTKDLDIRGGTIKANGGEAEESGDGAYSAGVAAIGALSVSGGFLTAQGGRAASSTGAAAQSSGVYAEADSIRFSGGTVNATGDRDCNKSYGIKNAGILRDHWVYSNGGVITVSDTAVVTATGGDTTTNSYGLYCRGDGLTVSGGTLNATSRGTGPTCIAVLAEDSGSKITVSGGSFTAIAGVYALSKALETGDNVTAKGSISSDGSNPKPYTTADNCRYKWVNAEPTVTSVQVNPTTVSVQKGGTQNFNATVMGADRAQTVTWTVEDGVADTRIEPNGALTIAADETATSLTVRATSTVNTAISGTATVTVTPAPAVTTVEVNPASVSIQKGGNQTFSATVTGTNSPAQTVTWSVTGGVTGTVIDANGKLTVAASETATSLIVKATSTVNTSKFGTAAVTVTTPTVYEITQGQHGQWLKGSGKELGFTADADYSKFTNGGSVSVDGSVIAGSNYTSQSGSTIVTLNAAYLETLAAGRHTLRINFTDGYAETDFIIPGAGGDMGADVPKTGDNATPVLWLGLMLLAGAGLAVSAVRRRRRQNG